MIEAPPKFSEEAAEMLLAEMRWPPHGSPVCPACDSVGRVYRLHKRRKFACMDCTRQFSVTSGTVFDHRSLSLEKCVQALWLYEESEGEIRSVELSRALGVTYKTAHIMKRRLWEAYFGGTNGPLSSPIFIYRGAWQGFNVWFRDSATGEILRRNLHGQTKPAWPRSSYYYARHQPPTE